MSVEGMIASQIAGQSGQANLLLAIQDLSRQIQLSRDFAPAPYIFLKSDNDSSVNQAVNTIIVKGLKTPPGFRGTVKDFNITFTAAGGTVKIVILDPHGEIFQDVNRGITANSNGTGDTVLDENETLGVVVETQGAGTIRVYFSGVVQRFRI